MKREEIEEHFAGATYSINVEAKDGQKYGIILRPYIDIYISGRGGKILRYELLKYGINTTEFKYGLRICGISVCNLSLKFAKAPDWWLRVIKMMREKKHLEPEGILKIISLRNINSKSKNIKWSYGETVKHLSKYT